MAKPLTESETYARQAQAAECNGMWCAASSLWRIASRHAPTPELRESYVRRANIAHDVLEKAEERTQ